MSKAQYGSLKKYHFIYKTTNILTGRYYIGMHSTNNLDDGYLGSGTRLRYSINKYGKENHKIEILEFVESREELRKRESEIVNLDEIAKHECMNLRLGGSGGFSLANRKKGSNALKTLRKDPIFVDKLKQSISAALKLYYQHNASGFKGKTHTEETKRKISIAKKGKCIGQENSQYGTFWITNGLDNKKLKSGTVIPAGWYKGRMTKFK